MVIKKLPVNPTETCFKIWKKLNANPYRHHAQNKPLNRLQGSVLFQNDITAMAVGISVRCHRYARQAD